MIDIITTFLLGLAVIIHPCTIAPNIAAMSYLGGKGQGKDVMWMYIIGHTLLYALLGIGVTLLLKFGIVSNGLEAIIKEWGQPVLITVFLVAGILLIVSFFLNHEHHHAASEFTVGCRGAFISGVFVAVAFCPEAALGFFGVLIPMSLTSHFGLSLPVVFAAATVIPLIGLEWLLRRGMAGRLAYIKKMTRWFNLVIGIMFLLAVVAVYFL